MSSNPYASPSSSWDAPHVGKPGEPPQWPYRPTTALVSWLTGLFWTLIVCYSLMLVMEILEATLLADVVDHFNDGRNLDEEGFAAAGLGLFGAMFCVGVGLIPVYLATAVLYCVWINRANKNSRALGAQEMKISPGWSVGWWFVPLANLVMPYKAVREIYLASQPGAEGLEWRDRDAPLLLGWWWAFWVLANIAGRAELRMSIRDDPQMNDAAVWVGIVGSVLSIAAAYTCLRIVRSIHARQEQTAAKLPVAAASAWS